MIDTSITLSNMLFLATAIFLVANIIKWIMRNKAVVILAVLTVVMVGGLWLWFEDGGGALW